MGARVNFCNGGGERKQGSSHCEKCPHKEAKRSYKREKVPPHKTFEGRFSMGGGGERLFLPPAPAVNNLITTIVVAKVIKLLINYQMN